MIVEVLPHLWRVHLYECIERGAACNEQTKKCGVEGADVVEMNDVGSLRGDLSYQIEQLDDHDNNQKNEQVDIGESGDKLRYGVVGHHIFNHPRLMHPSEAVVCCG